MPTLKGARGGLLAPQTLVEQLRALPQPHQPQLRTTFSERAAATVQSMPQGAGVLLLHCVRCFNADGAVGVQLATNIS